MAELTESERGVLLSSMSPASAGMMLGRSAAWVQRQRAALAAAPAGGDREGTFPPMAGPRADPGPGLPEPVQRAVGRAIDPAELDPLPEAPGKPRALTPRRAARGAPGVTRLKPVTPAIVRWAGWFLDARWPLQETADLFDVDGERLISALEAA